MTMNKYELIEKYLDELIPNPVCELNYFNDYSLLIAIMLSAQTTDKRVNEVTKELFSKYCGRFKMHIKKSRRRRGYLQNL